jgi:hypothetical protein
MRRYLVIIFLPGCLCFVALSFVLDHIGRPDLGLYAVGLAFVCLVLVSFGLAYLLMQLHYRTERRRDEK